jgi:hypothetical protein
MVQHVSTEIDPGRSGSFDKEIGFSGPIFWMLIAKDYTQHE